jgi:hypothetical protein
MKMNMKAMQVAFQFTAKGAELTGTTTGRMAP